MAGLSLAAQPPPSLPLLQDRGYIIRDCGASTDQIALGLDLGKEPIGAAINVAKQGVSGSHGFRAFFKNDAAIGPVTKMLKDIQTLRPARGMRPNIFKAQSPEFICVTPETRSRYRLRNDPYVFCEQKGQFGMWFRGEKYVFLCQKFFTIKISPPGPPAKFCPRVIDNMFERKGYLLADYQKYLLIHELVHFYLGQKSLGWTTNPNEKYRLNECVDMDPKNSLKNPMHWQYFVAMVEQKCTDEPDPFAPPFPLPPGALAADNGNDSSVAFDAI
ncbi:MAG: hypothetical protein Q9184_003164 [Pyrenodesmia sp. 2 TL-2023]